MGKMVKIVWNAKKYVDSVNKQTGASIRRASQLVIKTTRAALNTPGETATAPTGLNDVKKKDRMASGLDRIQGLTTRGKKQHHGGSFGGVSGIYWNEASGKWTTASRPGTPPHKQTGLLRRRIDAQYSRDGLSAKVGPKDELVYGRIQELGGKTRRGTLPPRPYLGPSFDACQEMIVKIIRYGIRQAEKVL